MKMMVKAACLIAFPLIVWKSGLISEAELGTLLSAREKTMAGLFRRRGLVMGR
jgi:hypothetical protein